MHLIVIALAVAFFMASYVFLFKSLNEAFQIQHEINAKLPPDRKFEPLFWGPGTRVRFRQLQRELLPDSPRLRRLRRLNVTCALLFLSGIVLLFVTLRR